MDTGIESNYRSRQQRKGLLLINSIISLKCRISARLIKYVGEQQ